MGIGYRMAGRRPKEVNRKALIITFPMKGRDIGAGIRNCFSIQFH
jgi:hypothetical protein